MGGWPTILAVVLLVALAGSGCTSCHPKDTFDCLDRCCYLPDWTNCRSCNSECWRKDGYNYRWTCPCQDPAAKVGQPRKQPDLDIVGATL